MLQIIAVVAGVLLIGLAIGLFCAFLTKTVLAIFGIQVSIWAAWALYIVVMMIANAIGGFARGQGQSNG